MVEGVREEWGAVLLWWKKTESLGRREGHVRRIGESVGFYYFSKTIYKRLIK